MTPQAKPPGSAATAPRGDNLKPRKGFKGRVDHITQRSQTRPHTQLSPGRRGYVCRLINKQGEEASADA